MVHKASLRNLFHLTYTTSSVILFLYQLFVSIRKGFITRSLGLKRSQEFSYAQQAAGTSGFFYLQETASILRMNISVILFFYA